LPLAAQAQADGYHWAYASYFGTGRYTLDGHTETVVLSAMPAWTWREPSLDPTGQRTIGYRFRVPISVGATEFDSIDGIGELDLDSINSISVVPGVEIEMPISARFSLKPLAYLGFGAEPGGGDQAEIFRFGVRSRIQFQLDDTAMDIVNGLERIGYSGESASDAINLVQLAFDFSRPLVNSKINGATVAISWHVMYTSYLDSLGLDLRAASLRPSDVDGEWELGVAFGKQSGDLSFWRLKFERVGLAYRFAADGDFSGVGLVFKSLFDR
jgi:hypothetical protein